MFAGRDVDGDSGMRRFNTHADAAEADERGTSESVGVWTSPGTCRETCSGRGARSEETEEEEEEKKTSGEETLVFLRPFCGHSVGQMRGRKPRGSIETQIALFFLPTTCFFYTPFCLQTQTQRERKA